MKWLKGRPGGARHLSEDRARRRFRPRAAGGQRGRGRWPPLPRRAPASTDTINAFSRLAPPPAERRSGGRGPRYQIFVFITLFNFSIFCASKKARIARELLFACDARMALVLFNCGTIATCKMCGTIIYLGPLLSPAFFVGSYYGSW